MKELKAETQKQIVAITPEIEEIKGDVEGLREKHDEVCKQILTVDQELDKNGTEMTQAEEELDKIKVLIKIATEELKHL